MSQSNTSSASIDIYSELCKGCFLCIEACPRGSIARGGGLNSRGYTYAYYTGEGCTGCGLCFYSCPEPGAITVYRKGKEEA